MCSVHSSIVTDSHRQLQLFFTHEGVRQILMPVLSLHNHAPRGQLVDSNPAFKIWTSRSKAWPAELLWPISDQLSCGRICMCQTRRSNRAEMMNRAQKVLQQVRVLLHECHRPLPVQASSEALPGDGTGHLMMGQDPAASRAEGSRWLQAPCPPQRWLPSSSAGLASMLAHLG